MTEELIEQNLDSQEPVIDETLHEEVVETTDEQEEHQEAVEEKMIPQSQVSKIVAREKRRERQAAEERALRILEERLQGSQQPQQQQKQEPALDLANLTQEQLDKYIDAKSAQREEQRHLMRFAREFDTKIKAAVDADPDFEDALEDLELTNHPKLALLVNEFDNTAEMLKELSKNPRSYSELTHLTSSGSLRMARKQLLSLSTSIKQNKQAKKTPKVPAPLSQSRPSNVSVGGNKKPSVSELRLKYKV